MPSSQETLFGLYSASTHTQLIIFLFLCTVTANCIFFVFHAFILFILSLSFSLSSPLPFLFLSFHFFFLFFPCFFVQCLIVFLPHTMQTWYAFCHRATASIQHFLTPCTDYVIYSSQVCIVQNIIFFA